MQSSLLVSQLTASPGVTHMRPACGQHLHLKSSQALLDVTRLSAASATARIAALSRASTRNRIIRSGLHFCTLAQNGPSEETTNGAANKYTGNKSLGVVITGGTKGIGFALARKFLESNDRVVICGRDEKRLKNAIIALQQENNEASIHGITCDVSSSSDVERLAEFAGQQLGVIDRWLNNAGEVTSKKMLGDVDAKEIIRVCGSNVIGSLLCCREAIRYMRQQRSSMVPIYHIFNMGFSQWGVKFTKSSCTHKATKIALTQLTESLCEELKSAGTRSIGVHNLSPGLVLTDLLLKDSTPLARRFFNTLAEEPETVAAILAPQIRAVQGSGQSLEVLSPVNAVFKVVTGFPQILSGGRFFDKDGNRVITNGKRYYDNGVEIIY